MDTPTTVTGFYIGLDLGQAADYSALVVNERAQIIETGRTTVYHRIRWLHRYPLGTAYPAIVESVGRVLAQLPEARDKPELWIDQTGVGRGVSDIFRAAGMRPVCVSITGGTAVNRVVWDDIRVPKRELASVTQAVLQTGRVTIAADLPFARVLEDELSNFRVKITTTGNETFEGRSGVHDDLVLALAIALWAAEKRNAVAGASMLELAAREMDAYHAANGGKPAPIPRTYAPGSVEYAAQQAALEAAKDSENND